MAKDRELIMFDEVMANQHLEGFDNEYLGRSGLRRNVVTKDEMARIERHLRICVNLARLTVHKYDIDVEIEETAKGILGVLGLHEED